MREADSRAAEATSDTCLVLSPLAEALEADLGKPVFSANMVTMWHALRLAGVRDSPPGFGSLNGLHPARGHQHDRPIDIWFVLIRVPR